MGNSMNKLFASFGLFLVLLTYQAACHAALDLEDINGRKIPVSSLHGKWVFINYWASWCGPCVHEISEFNHFASKHADNVEVFAVNFDSSSLPKQRRLVKDFSIQYPSLNPSSLKPLHLDDITVVPVTYVFDPNGNLNTTLYGGQTERSLQELVSG